jgi:hypothetical protein
MSRRAVSTRALLIAAGAAALVAPPLLLRAEPENWTAVKSTVANMSQTERDRLDRNTREYQALSDAERQAYRALHTTLEQDLRTGNGKLASTMSDYHAWLATNQAYDRQALSAETDPADRIAEIQRIVDKRDAAANRSRFFFSRFLLHDLPELSPSQLTALMTGVEARLPMTVEEQARLLDAKGQERTGVVRHFTVFTILREHEQTVRQFLEQNDAESLIAEAGVGLPPEFDAAPADERRTMIARLIVGNVLREYERAVNRKPASTQDLQKIVDEWSQDPAEQQRLVELLEQEPSNFRHALKEIYAKNSIALDGRVLRDVGADLMGRGPFGGRGRGGPDDRERGDRGDGRGPLRQFGERMQDRREGGPRPDGGAGPPPGERPPGPPGGPRPGERRPPPRDGNDPGERPQRP